MKRKIIEIDEENATAAGRFLRRAGQLRLPACPTGAITFAEREAAPYDHAAVSCPASVIQVEE